MAHETPELGKQKQEGPWGACTRQSNIIAEFQARERLVSKEVDILSGDSIQGLPLDPTCIHTHVSMHTPYSGRHLPTGKENNKAKGRIAYGKFAE